AVMVRFLLSSLLITGLLFATNVRAEQRCPPEILKGRAFSGEVINLDAPIADYVFKRALTLRRGRSIRNINEDFQYPYYGDLDIEISPTDDLQNLAQTLRPESEESQKQIVQLLESLRSQSGNETIYVSMDTFLPPIFQPNFNS